MKSKSKSVKLIENLGSTSMSGVTCVESFHPKIGHVCESTSSMQGNDGYFCGACRHQFETICQLHVHLQGSHTSRGCYHYDSKLKTAFPKYDAVCCFTQTASPEEKEKRTRKQSTGRLKKVSLVSRRTRVSRNEADDSKTIKTTKSNFTNIASSIKLLEVTEQTSQKSVDCISSISSTQSNDLKENSTSCVADLKTQIEESVIHCEFPKPDSNSAVRKPAKKHQKPTKLREKLKSVKTLPSAKKAGKTKLSRPIIVEQSSSSGCRRKDKAQQSLQQIQSKAMQIDNTAVELNCRPDILPDPQEKSYLRDSNQLHNPVLNCSFCNIAFNNQGDLDKHIYTEHPSSEYDKTSNKIHIQQKKSAEINDVKADEQGDKCVKRNSESKSPYTCEECGHVMPWNKKDVHKRLHSGERPYICELCGKGLISKNKLKRHMMTHSDVKKHKCEVCGVGFQMKYKLRMHMHIHTGKKPYLCSICGAEFNHSSNLATHTRCVHLQIKPHECSVCGGKYAKKSQLDDHMLSHSSEKQFTCRFCGKSFKYQKGMKRHEKTHEDDKSLRCEKCEAQFVHKSDFLHHISVAHKAGPVRCLDCKKIFSNEDDLKEHKATDCDKKKYQCSICGEYYKVCNQYFTHMLAAHGIEREQAKLLHTEHKLKKNTEQVCSMSVNQNLYSPINVPSLNVTNSEIVKDSNSEQNPSFNVRQMFTGLLEENKSTISALTRVATENLRLHSQDIQEEEKINSMIIPPLNPSIMLCRNVEENSFSRSNNVIASNQTHSATDVVHAIQLSNNLTCNMQPENNSYLPANRDGLFLPDRNINRTSLLNMAGGLGVNQTSEIIGGNLGDRSQTLNTISMIPISTSICAGQVALLEHESTLALRRLAENADSQVVNQSILAGSNSNLPMQESGNHQQPPAVGFSIQNLF